MYIKWIVSKDLLCSIGNYTQYFVINCKGKESEVYAWVQVSCSVASDSFMTAWTVARQPPQSMGLSWQEYWGGLPFPPTGDLPDPGIEPESPAAAALVADSLPLGHLGSPKYIYSVIYVYTHISELLCHTPEINTIRSDQSLRRVRLFVTP